jgi:hypothetical protein
LTGYTANASAIKLGSPETSKVASAAVQTVARAILAEAVDPGLDSEAVSNPYVRDPALVAAIAFFLVGKATRMLWCMYVSHDIESKSG